MPPGGEAQARAFYGDLLGMPELPKPSALRTRGGCWFAAGDQELHVGVEDAFRPAGRAHPGLVVRELASLRARLRDAGVPFEDDARVEGVDRLFLADPFGNRIELRQLHQGA